MTLDSSGFFDWAWRLECDYNTLLRDGGKLISHAPNALEFNVGHSLEGHVWITPEIRALAGKGPQNCTPAERTRVLLALNAAYWAWRDPERASTSWHGTNLRGVTALVQHAPVFARLAHGNAANPRGPGWEHEGVEGTPIDDYQVATSLRITNDMNAFYRKSFVWRMHREFGPTSCPSERLAPLFAALAGGRKEIELSSQEYIELKAELASLRAVTVGTREREAALAQNEPVEKRLDSIERQDGWLDKRLDTLEAAVEVLQTASPAEVRALAEQITKLGAAIAGIHQATAA